MDQQGGTDRPEGADGAAALPTSRQELGSASADLARAWADGQPGAFAEVFGRYVGSLLGAATVMLADRAAAEGVVLETLRRAARDVGLFDPPDDLRTWLFLALRDQVRGVQSAAAAPGTDAGRDPGGATTPGAGGRATTPYGGSDQPFRDLFVEAARTLTPSQRELLALSVFGGLDPDSPASGVDADSRQVTTGLELARDRMYRAVAALLLAQRRPRDCPELAQLLVGNGRPLTDDVVARIARHAAGCPACRRHWASTGVADPLSAGSWGIGANDALWSRMQASLRTRDEPSALHPAPVAAPVVAAPRSVSVMAAAGAAVVVVAGVVVAMALSVGETTSNVALESHAVGAVAVDPVRRPTPAPGPGGAAVTSSRGRSAPTVAGDTPALVAVTTVVGDAIDARLLTTTGQGDPTNIPVQVSTSPKPTSILPAGTSPGAGTGTTTTSVGTSTSLGTSTETSTGTSTEPSTAAQTAPSGVSGPVIVAPLPVVPPAIPPPVVVSTPPVTTSSGTTGPTTTPSTATSTAPSPTHDRRSGSPSSSTTSSTTSRSHGGTTGASTASFSG